MGAERAGSRLQDVGRGERGGGQGEERQADKKALRYWDSTLGVGGGV